MNRAAVVVLLVLVPTMSAKAQDASAIPAYLSAALADPARPPEHLARDGRRKAAEVIAFAGLKPGDRVADFMPEGGYFTRIFSRLVGPKGRVYAYVPTEEIKNCDPGETAPGLALAHDKTYANLTVMTGPVNEYHAPEKLDMVWTAQNYHDLYDPFMGPADLAVLDKAVFDSLKQGGVFLVIDHAAEDGSGTRDTNTLHRIDPAIIKRDVEAVGFKLEAESDVLRNPADTHELKVFDPAVRGHTDQVVLKFVRP